MPLSTVSGMKSGRCSGFGRTGRKDILLHGDKWGFNIGFFINFLGVGVLGSLCLEGFGGVLKAGDAYSVFLGEQGGVWFESCEVLGCGEG